MVSHKTILGDCFNVEQELEKKSVDLIYLDPPFFTQKNHSLTSRDGHKSFNFNDVWESDSEYADYIYQRLSSLKAVLKHTGSLFFHCDKTASHIARLLLDKVFGQDNFQSEIIWYFKRWSNSKKGLLSTHHTIFFYSKSQDFKFNKLVQDYSPSTNIDQIMQKRARDQRGKSVYALGENGEVLTGGTKKGVALSDVWEIPFLNPKAKERVGYPTQKPVLLLKRIIELTTEKDDLVLDPFCGSGTTLVAANALHRNSIGFDISEDAIRLTKERLSDPIVTRSTLLEKGKNSYKQHSREAASVLKGLDYTPIQRNRGIDGLLKKEMGGKPVFIRVQRSNEPFVDALEALKISTKRKGDCERILIRTVPNLLGLPYHTVLDGIHILPNTAGFISQLIDDTENGNIVELFPQVTSQR